MFKIWQVCIKDDLNDKEKFYLDSIEHYEVFNGLFVVKDERLEEWKSIQPELEMWLFDDITWYVTNGLFEHDVFYDEFDKISEVLYQKDDRSYSKLVDIVNGEDSLEDVEDYIATQIENISEKELKKMHLEKDYCWDWLGKKILKFMKYGG